MIDIYFLDWQWPNLAKLKFDKEQNVKNFTYAVLL